MPRKIFTLVPWLLVLAFAAGACVTVKINIFEEEKPLREQVIAGEGRDKILLLDLSGLMLETSRGGIWRLLGPTVTPGRVKEELDKAAQDPRVKALVLRINSPGGSVSAADQIYHALVRFKKERGLPVVACFMGLAASGGYYVAQAADVIVAHPTTLTGSIGVVAMKFNLKGLMDKVGVHQDTIKSGPWKDFWSPFRPATEAEKQMMQAIIDEYHRRFVELVAAHRRLSPKEIQQVADGRIFTARQALALNLVDQTGYLDDAVDLARQKAALTRAKVIRYDRPDTYRPTLYSLAPELLSELGPQFFYLYAWGEDNPPR